MERLGHRPSGSSIDILSDEELGRASSDWKGDYKQWMHPKTLRDSWAASQQEWHQILRGAFRTFLFHIAGSYELTISFYRSSFQRSQLGTLPQSVEQLRNWRQSS